MNSFIQFISNNGLFAMFLIIMLEYACFPISSEIVLPFFRGSCIRKTNSIFIIIFTSVIAGMIGTSFCYMVGRFGGTALLNRIAKRFPKPRKELTLLMKSLIIMVVMLCVLDV